MKKKIGIVMIVIAAVLLITLSGRLLETNQAGHFQIKQAIVTGTITVRTTPGMYWQGLGRIIPYKNVATIGFGREKGEGTADIGTIPVIFNDGSKADISGLVRIKLPNTETGAKELIKEYSGGFDHFIQAGALPVIKNAVKLSANLRSAQDAYTTLALFQQAVEDQLVYGTYVTKSAVIYVERSTGRTIKNPKSTDDFEEKKVTIVVMNDAGLPKRVPNRLSELGCEILECVVDVPDFDKAVEAMIAKRKDEAMKTELAKQEAIRAKQDAITTAEQGKANVAKAKYEEEVIKEKAVVVAQRKFEVATLAAKEANQEKKKKILLAEAKRAELDIADGLSAYAEYKINKDVEAKIGVAKALATWVGPKIVMTGGGDGSGGVENALMIQMMMKLADEQTK